MDWYFIAMAVTTVITGLGIAWRKWKAAKVLLAHFAQAIVELSEMLKDDKITKEELVNWTLTWKSVIEAAAKLFTK